MSERPDTESPSEEPTRAEGSGWSAAEETAALADAPTAGVAGGQASPPVIPEPPVLDPNRDIGPAPTFAGPRPDGGAPATPSVTPHTGASGPAGGGNDRPEVVIGGAFAGALVLGLILKRLGS